MIEFIGQNSVKEQIEILISASKQRGIPVPHLIFYGQAGLGKTAMGKLIAGEMGSELHYCVGNTFEPERQLLLLSAGDILFVDELHRLRPSVEEVLYTPLTDFTLIFDKGTYKKNFDIEPFTFVGATTQLGRITKPLRDRCLLNIHFKPYSGEDMKLIVNQYQMQSGLNLNKELCNLIAKVSRGVPRLAIRIIEFLLNFCVSNRIFTVSHSILKEVLELMSLSEDGLTVEDLQYLKLLYDSDRPIGRTAIASTLGLDIKTVTDVIEPYLMENDYVVLSDRGRILTRKGLDRIR
jgi:Holliday junction DNA helicase RuvB